MGRPSVAVCLGTPGCLAGGLDKRCRSCSAWSGAARRSGAAVQQRGRCTGVGCDGCPTGGVRLVRRALHLRPLECHLHRRRRNQARVRPRDPPPPQHRRSAQQLLPGRHFPIHQQRGPAAGVPVQRLCCPAVPPGKGIPHSGVRRVSPKALSLIHSLFVWPCEYCASMPRSALMLMVKTASERERCWRRYALLPGELPCCYTATEASRANAAC